jgi:hypothetical protein
MKRKPPQHDQTSLIREWAAAYRLWNEQELVRRQAMAGQESVQEKLAAFFDLCETMFQIAPRKSMALYRTQLYAHGVERERMRRFEELRTRGKSAA